MQNLRASFLVVHGAVAGLLAVLVARVACSSQVGARLSLRCAAILAIYLFYQLKVRKFQFY
jgi:hypothetical protein